MTSELALRNLGLYSLQIVILTAVAALLPWISRLRAPRPQLAFWYVVLAICVLLPMIQPWAQPPVESSSVSATSVVLTPGDGSGGRHGLVWRLGWAATVLLALAVGTVFRVGLLALGMLRLRRLAEHAGHVPALPSIERAATATQASAGFLCSDEITGPVTFGFRKPVVLVPPGFFELGAAEQESVAIHELLHVRRRDWLCTLAEECVRAALWFHPAIWFLLNRVQLAREQSVDETVVRFTRRSEEYIGALLKIAGARIEPDLAPAPLFLKKRHLRERVAAIVQGVNMSKSRLTLTMIAVLSVLPVVAGILAWQIPLQAAPQEVGDAQGVEVNTGSFKVLHRNSVEYPAEARKRGISGDVVTSVTVNGDGEVIDAAVVSGPQELRSAVLESVLGWHFSTGPGTLPSSFQVAVHFTASSAAPVSQPPVTFSGSLRVTVDAIDTSTLSQALREKVEAALPVHAGETVGADQLQELFKTITAVDSHLTVRPSRTGDKDRSHVTFRIALRPTQPSTGLSSAVAQPVTGNSSQRIRVGGNVQATNLVSKVMPKYPADAKQAGVQGVVQMEAVIGKDGTVKNLELISGDQLLVPSAMEAVKQWVYRPTLLNGNPVEVITQIDVNYTLAP